MSAHLKTSLSGSPNPALAPEPANAGATRTKYRAVWSRARGLASGTHSLALADQVVVSGASFLTTILIGRWTDSRELGFYALGVSLFSIALAIQDSLIALPYAIQAHRLGGTPAERAGNALAHNLLLSALAVVAFVAMGVALMAQGAKSEVVAMAWAISATAPFVLLREFGRRFSFAHLNMGEALAIDTTVAIVQLILLVWLHWTGLMSAVTAIMAIAGACAFTGILWLAFARTKFSVERTQVQSSMAESWGLGRWLFAAAIPAHVQWHVTNWLLVISVDAAAAGVYAACMSVVSFANPILTGLSNIFTPRAVLAWKELGSSGLLRQTCRDALLMATVMGTFSVCVFFAGEALMQILFPGAEYAGQSHAMSVLAIAFLAHAISVPASNAMASMERPRAGVMVGFVSLALTALLTWLLMRYEGLLGAAYGFLLGNLASAAGRWIAFLAIVRGMSSDASTARLVIRQLSQSIPAEGLTVTALGFGGHANVVAVRSADSRPVWRERQSVALKLYKPQARQSAEKIRAQFDLLAGQHSALDGRVVDEWKIFVPEPLAISGAPQAIVMTEIPGKDVYSWLSGEGAPAPESMDTIARAIIGALKYGWDIGLSHGDLALRNILCDVETKAISFIDFGAGENCLARHAPRPAAIGDLAHMLSDVLTDVKSTFFSPAKYARQSAFMSLVIEAFLETADTLDDKYKLLGAIRESARTRTEQSPPLLSPHRLWRAFVKYTAERRAESLYSQIEARLEATREPVSGACAPRAGDSLT